MNCTSCGANITDSREDGVNGTDYYECSGCGIVFNVKETTLRDDKDV